MRAPLSIHEALIDKHRARDQIRDPMIDSLHAAMVAARRHAERIADLPVSVMADKVYSQATNAEKLRKSVLALSEQAEKSLDEAAAKAGAELERVKAKIAVPPAPTQDSLEAGLEAECRAHLRSVTEKDRRAVLADAIQRDDMAVIGAVLRGPAMLSGMSNVERELRRIEWQRKTYPSELDRIQRLAKAIGAVERASRLVVAFAHEVADDAATSQPLQRRAQR
jgi:hypothetical protein